MWKLTEDRQSNEQKDTVVLLRRHLHLYLNTYTSLWVGRGVAKVMLLQGTAVMVKICRNNYVQCVRKCKMHTLNFQAYKVRVGQSDAGLTSVYVHARACV